MRYYEVAIKGMFVDTLTYESVYECESFDEVLVDIKNKKDVKAVVLKECEKPKFKTKSIKSKTGLKLSLTQFELAKFISFYYSTKLSFAMMNFECLKPYKCEKLEIKKEPQLSEAQKKALEFLEKENSSLLFADTGSGKTEIYIALAKKYIQEGKQVLILMPEIALTPQMQKRLTLYFEDKFFIWHSKISKKKKEENLKRLQNGEILLVAGARSALFLPFANLALIVVDEEHDNSYKASNNPKFNARDLALFLGQKLDIKVVLGSATPSVTSYYKQKSFRLKGTFFKSSKEIIYDDNTLSLSSTVLRELRASLRNNKQAIIFLPNRANFRQIFCPSCANTIKCPFCSIALSLHKDKNALKCHYCGFAKEIDKSCPTCNNHLLQAQKIGTAELCDMLEKELKDFKAVIAKFDSDEISSFTKLNKILKDFNDKKIDILVGTSMLAKGHDYHSVDLSVILGLDEYLFRPNYKALEESLALAMQVAGRAGRAGEARVLLQSKNQDFFQKYMSDYDLFLKDELEHRKKLYPPFVRLSRILIEHKDEERAKNLCFSLASQFLKLKSLEVVGYGACAISLMNAKFRFYILLRSRSYEVLIKAANFATQYENVSSDIDPIDFS